MCARSTQGASSIGCRQCSSRGKHDGRIFTMCSWFHDKLSGKAHVHRNNRARSTARAVRAVPLSMRTIHRRPVLRPPHVHWLGNREVYIRQQAAHITAQHQAPRVCSGVQVRVAGNGRCHANMAMRCAAVCAMATACAHPYIQPFSREHVINHAGLPWRVW